MNAPIGRRSLLRAAGIGGVAAAATTAGTGLALTRDTASAATPDASPAAPPAFHGPHQAGVLRSASPATIMLAFDVTATDKAGLTELFRTLTSRAAFLTGGGLPDQAASAGRPATPARWGRGGRGQPHGDPRRRLLAVRRPVRAGRAQAAPGCSRCRSSRTTTSTRRSATAT